LFVAYCGGGGGGGGVVVIVIQDTQDVRHFHDRIYKI